jgi:hypothetical protein
MFNGSAGPHRISGVQPEYSSLIAEQVCSDPSCENTDISRVHDDIEDRGEVCAEAQGRGECETGWSKAPDVQGSAIVSFINGEIPVDRCPFQASEGCGDGGRLFGTVC